MSSTLPLMLHTFPLHSCILLLYRSPAPPGSHSAAKKAPQERGSDINSRAGARRCYTDDLIGFKDTRSPSNQFHSLVLEGVGAGFVCGFQGLALNTASRCWVSKSKLRLAVQVNLSEMAGRRKCRSVPLETPEMEHWHFFIDEFECTRVD